MKDKINAWDVQYEEREKATNFTLIQSYVVNCWFVSTAFIKSSVSVNSPPWYFETIVWEWDSNTREQGKMVEMKDSGSFPDQAIQSHFNICGNCLEGRYKP